ncbi:hypothetical protein [Prosthecomicrobium hirschii]|uniref:hypothetical protein n=1 Tax=Prosthecodimorpha hirschii TaxID=665126 RepID=UPI002221061C|nr:hypothetical protein [Prosthecomicrobium hirschii]MCW1844143.1 hypothetical protein [Prosthecomicrobium hirschii]
MNATHTYLAKSHAVAFVSNHFATRGLRPAIHSAHYDRAESEAAECDVVNVGFSLGASEFSGSVCIEQDGRVALFEYL